MNGKMTILKAGGEVVVREYAETPPLADLQKAVGGYIEAVPGFDTFGADACWVVCNEEGKLHGLPFNANATKAWAKALGMGEGDLGDVLVGDIAVLTGDDGFMEAL